MKSRKGGYKLVSLQFGELTTMTALAGLHASIENSHDKPLLISDIVINGERKNNAFAIAEKDGDAYIIKGVYGYDIKVNANDEIECEPIDDRDVTLEVTDIKALTKKQCEQLKCGDKVLKKTGNQKHLYVVTYKEHHVGMCLSYVDASIVETQSYDYTGNTWVYNSEDKTPLINIEGAESGTIVDALGLNGEGKLVKGTISGGGTKLYYHSIKIQYGSEYEVYNLEVVTNFSNPFTSISTQYGRYGLVFPVDNNFALFSRIINLANDTLTTLVIAPLLNLMYLDSTDNSVKVLITADIISATVTDTVTGL